MCPLILDFCMFEYAKPSLFNLSSLCVKLANLLAQALVEGIYPNNTARIIKNVTVCRSIMYMVDHVLIPAPSLEQLPPPHPLGSTSAALQVRNVSYVSGPSEEGCCTKSLRSMAK
jgi:hypothetical protein